LKGHTSVLMALTPPEHLVKNAVRHGCYLTVKQAKAIAQANKVPQPTGTGKVQKNGKNTLLKVDWAKSLVKFCFPGACQSEFQIMVDGIMGIRKTELCPQEVLESFECLDLNEAQTFKGLKQVAEKVKKDAESKANREQPGKCPAIICVCVCVTVLSSQALQHTEELNGNSRTTITQHQLRCMVYVVCVVFVCVVCVCLCLLCACVCALFLFACVVVFSGVVCVVCVVCRVLLCFCLGLASSWAQATAKRRGKSVTTRRGR
jgi:hypothetical protein